jgi:DNA repair protein RAD5
MEERVEKKRRFFKDDVDDTTEIPASPIPEIPEIPLTPVPSSPTIHVKQTAFSEQLVAILDQHLSSHVISKLEDASAGNIERAVNMYFDGSWETHDPPEMTRHLITTQQKRPLEPTMRHFVTRSPVSPKHSSPSVPRHGSQKYIGSLGVDGWAISSGTNILKAGDPLLIERQNPKPSNPSRTAPISKSKTTAPPPRFPLPQKQGKQHMLVRFTTTSGREIGRLPQETATFVSTLIDQNICFFDGICIYAPDRIRTGDNILLQLRCFLLPHIFKPITASKQDRPGVWQVSETDEERALKLRRVGLLHLFNAIGLEPLRTNAIIRQTKNAREQLIMAAQIPDPSAKPMTRTSSQSSPSDDDGEEVAEDTLNMLYKKAQMYDPDMPTMDPPTTFKFELRKYQKQALCWLVSKESGDDNVRKQQSLNPLWEEYVWPQDESNDKENITTPNDNPTDKFYLNPYSGEMSLSMPTYNSMHKGGILADGKPPPFF